MTDTVTVTIALPINGTPLERAQAIVAAMYANGSSIAGMALGQLLGDMRPYIETGPIEWPRAELRFYRD